MTCSGFARQELVMSSARTPVLSGHCLLETGPRTSGAVGQLLRLTRWHCLRAWAEVQTATE